jgi:hypothetical protein
METGSVSAASKLLKTTPGLQYFEVHVHGGMKTKDIQEVIFKKNPSTELQSAMKDKGVPWRKA